MTSQSPQWTSALQLSGMDLLPLNLAKQNLLYAALDCIGLNTAVGMGWLQISHVSEAWYWEPQRGDVGQANITLRTMRDKPGAAIGEVCCLLHIVSHALPAAGPLPLVAHSLHDAEGLPCRRWLGCCQGCWSAWTRRGCPGSLPLCCGAARSMATPPRTRSVRSTGGQAPHNYASQHSLDRLWSKALPPVGNFQYLVGAVSVLMSTFAFTGLECMHLKRHAVCSADLTVQCPKFQQKFACMQIAAVTGSGEGVRAYDLRDPLVTIPEYPHRPQGRSLLLALGILALLGTATAIAGADATSLPSANGALSFPARSAHVQLRLLLSGR